MYGLTDLATAGQSIGLIGSLTLLTGAWITSRIDAARRHHKD